MARKGLGGRLQRGARLARTGARGATGIASAKAREFTGGDRDDEAMHRELAGQLAEVLGDMKGAAMKVGQLLSFVDLDLPPDVRNVYHEALAQLRDAAPAFDPEAIAEVIAEEYGAPAEEVFAEFDPEPLASASIGQVHAAVTEDGREVVIKVQYPGVAEAVRADLKNAEIFAPLARVISPNQEIGPLLDELRERVDDELDYQREARYQRAFATRYQDHPFIHVPDIVGNLCRSRVLVSDRVQGIRFDELVRDGSEDERQRVGEIVFRYAFGSIGRFRLFNGDPHPGNYLVEEEGTAADGGRRVAFLDYGSVKMFTRERWVSMRTVEQAVAREDREAAIGALREAGFLPRNAVVDEERLHDWFRLYMRPVNNEQPFTFTPEYAAEVIRSTTDPRSPYSEVLRRLNLPPDYLLLNRIQWGLNSVLARLCATNDWQSIRDEYVAADAAPATKLGELDADWWAGRQESEGTLP